MMPAVAAVAVFSLDGTTHTWADVIDHARTTGVWADVERLAAASEAVAAAIAAGALDSAPLTADDEHELVIGFRRRHRLIAADELREWLTYWELDLPTWRRAVTRLALVERCQLADPLAELPAPDVEVVEAAVWPTAVTSGSLEEALATFAGHCAVRAYAGERGQHPAPSELEGWFAAQVLTADVVARAVDRRQLEWSRFDLETVRLAHDDAGREALACYHFDGMTLADVARVASAPVERETLLLEEAVPERRPVLLGAGAGDVLGPLPTATGVDVVVVHDRRPATSDPALRARVQRELLAKAVQREIDERISWREGWYARP